MSDSVINISADGDLFLDNLTFTAPNISVSGLTGVTMGNNVVLNASSAIIIASGKTSVPTVIIQTPTLPIVKWSYLDILQGGGGAVLTIGDGGSIGAGSGYILNAGNNIPVVGGTLIIGSGGIFTTNSVGTGQVVNVTSVPEPSTYAFMLLGVGLISLRRRFSSLKYCLMRQ
ncbi:MAG: PEP-CTERM sorting domain-containing protein [Pseudomonadota bacterium]